MSDTPSKTGVNSSSCATGVNVNWSPFDDPMFLTAAWIIAFYGETLRKLRENGD